MWDLLCKKRGGNKLSAREIKLKLIQSSYEVNELLIHGGQKTKRKTNSKLIEQIKAITLKNYIIVDNKKYTFIYYA